LNFTHEKNIDDLIEDSPFSKSIGHS